MSKNCERQKTRKMVVFLRTGKEAVFVEEKGKTSFPRRSQPSLIVRNMNMWGMKTIHRRYSPTKDMLNKIQRSTLAREATFKKKKTGFHLEFQNNDVHTEKRTEMKAGKLIEERHKCSNDVETNPGPQSVNFKELEDVVKLSTSKQRMSRSKIYQNISNINEDAMNRKIPMSSYTEKNLITIQNIFDLSIRDNYQREVRKKLDNLLRHFYDKVKEEEEQNSQVRKKQTPKKANIAATLKKDASTQYPEKHVNDMDHLKMHLQKKIMSPSQ